MREGRLETRAHGWESFFSHSGVRERRDDYVLLAAFVDGGSAEEPSTRGVRGRRGSFCSWLTWTAVKKGDAARRRELSALVAAGRRRRSGGGEECSQREMENVRV
ncbi:phosphoribosylanthranilate isomerase [Sesbania bispinosa]|nr:phosphoribosylanthranilate isomerase [Sesbania bispinosa]